MTTVVPSLASSLIGDLLAKGHAVRFQARGDSMHPVIRSDDYLHVERVELSDLAMLAPGDVVLTHSARGLTAHRIVACRRDRIVTRGDNSTSPDSALPLSSVLGQVTAVERNGVSQPLSRLSLLDLAANRVRARLRRIRTAASFSVSER
jgi:hypothetical protein